MEIIILALFIVLSLVTIVLFPWFSKGMEIMEMKRENDRLMFQFELDKLFCKEPETK